MILDFSAFCLENEELLIDLNSLNLENYNMLTISKILYFLQFIIII